MQGRRVNGNIVNLLGLAKGDYCFWNNTWYACLPNGLIANLGNHTIVEHEDKTISVSPSILCQSHILTWHGYLEKGVWREC